MSTSPTPEPGQPTDRKWRAIISGKRSAFAWAVTACLGAISISLAPRDNDIVRLLLPIGIMVSYVRLTYPPPSSEGTPWGAARISQLADSAYFLGFLWTLWALIDSFVIKKATPQSAFQVFGYALITTLGGTAIRLFLLNFKYTPADQAAEAQFTVESNLQLFSSVAQGASASIRIFHQDMEGLSKEIENLVQTLTGLDTQFADTHRQTTKAVTGNISSTVEEIRSALKSPVQEYGRA